MKTESAKASSAIKKELKKNFANIKFSVKSSNYSGGDSVHIKWTDGPTTDEVEKITNKYQYGNFDGTTDMYNYDNKQDDIPQSKYILTQRGMSDDTRLKIVEYLRNYYEACKNITIEDMCKYIPELQDHVQTLVYKKFKDISLT